MDDNPDASWGDGLKTFTKMREFLSWFDPAFFNRAKFIPRGRTVCAKTLYVLVPVAAMSHPELLRSWELFRNMRQHMFSVHPQEPIRSIVYAAQEPKDSGHGRWLVPEHVDKVLEITRNNMTQCKRPESLVILNGTWQGRKVTFAQQHRLFNSAAVAFGPHGTGMSNVLWMPCKGRPAAVEFICSQNAYKVRGCIHEGAETTQVVHQ